jgi:hypothetical protein
MSDPSPSSPPSARDIIQHYMPEFRTRGWGSVYADTSDFMRIGYGDVIPLGGLHYLVLRDEAERRFGSEDPKFWVKRCRVLETGEAKILKLVFYEQFDMQLGVHKITCYRSPDKEARILDLVRGDDRFMQGFTLPDAVGNAIRVLDLIRGRRLEDEISRIESDHRTYFFEHLPGLLDMYAGACEAIRHLHDHGEKHGDIRRDHLWFDSATGLYRWIDFDYAFDLKESPFSLDIFGLGNVLLFLIGQAIHSRRDLAEAGWPPVVVNSLEPGDFSLFHKRRIVNLRKLFPYVPEELNRVLMHFSAGAELFYDTVGELLDELMPCRDLIAKG